MIGKKTIDSYMEDREEKPCGLCGTLTTLRVLLPLRVVGEMADYPRCEKCSEHLEREYHRIRNMSEEEMDEELRRRMRHPD